MRAMPSESAHLSYFDAPFYTGRDHLENIWGDKDSIQKLKTPKLGFSDRAQYFEANIRSGARGLDAYLEWMRLRLIEVHRILKPDGSMFCHLDAHTVHYVKVIADKIFGFSNFRSQIIWKRTHAKGNAFRGFGNNADFILYYVRNKNFTWNAQFRAHDPDYVKKFYRHDDGDGRGPYQIADLSSPAYRPNLIYEFKGYKPPKKGWRITKKKMQKLDKERRLVFPKEKNGRIRQKLYLHEMKGTPIDNIWTDIPPIQPHSKEKTGWPTQKPLALLKRIIAASTNKGEVCFDCFAGCGSTAEAADQLKRVSWGIEISKTAVDLVKNRLTRAGANVTVIDEKDLDLPEVEDLPVAETSLKKASLK